MAIQTVHGTVCRISPDTGLLCHDPGTDDVRSVALAACRFPDHPNVLFVFDGSAQARTLHLTGDPWRGTIIPFRIGRTDQLGHHFLSHPLNGKHMSAEPPDAGGAGGLPVNRIEVRAWENFRLRPDSAEQRTSRQTAVAAMLGLLLDRVRSARDAAECLLAPIAPLSGECFTAVATLLPMAETEAFGRLCARDAGLADHLAALLPSDIWASCGLTGLAEYLSSGALSHSRLRRMDPDLDMLAEAGVHGQYWSFGHLCNAMARRSVLPTEKLCIVASCRNEGPYLLEWIAYHRAIGVTKFFLYSNDNDDASDDLLRALSQAGVIEWISNTIGAGGSPQYKSYGHALQLRPDVLDHEWSMFIDVDEFFVFDSAMFSSIVDYIEWQETRPTDAIALCWLVYGPARDNADPKAPVHRRFVKRRPAVDHHVKSIFRPRLFIHSTCHFPVWDDTIAWNFRSSARGDHRKIRDKLESSFSSSPSADFAWINHYISKSAEEFLLRRSFPRAEAATVSKAPLDIFSAAHIHFFRNLHDAQGFVEDERIAQCCPGFSETLRRLKRLPGVAGACAKIEAANNERLDALLRMIGRSERFSVPGSNERWFRDLLEQEGRTLG